jgi:hypothetical protein
MMTPVSKIFRMKKSRLFQISIFLLLFLVSCKLTRVGGYDAIVDKTINEVQQQLSSFFVNAETEAGTEAFSYVHYKNFYDGLKIEMSTLRIRSAAVNENSIADQEVVLLDENTRKLEQLHKLGIQNYEEIGLLKSGFEQQLAAIIKLQLALKKRVKS